jgi:hypothetical protein
VWVRFPPILLTPKNNSNEGNSNHRIVNGIVLFTVHIKSEEMSEGKRKINQAFRALRSKGYFARQNFWCCNTCGWHAVPDDKADKAVFYHEQAAANLKEDGECWLSWSGDGNEIVKVFQDAGVTANWNGESNQKIQIIQP